MTIEGKSLWPDTNGALVQASAAKFKAKFVCCFRLGGNLTRQQLPLFEAASFQDVSGVKRGSTVAWLWRAQGGKG